MSVHHVTHLRVKSRAYRVYDPKTGQRRYELRQDKRVGLVSVKVPERAFELFQLGRRQVGHVPRYNLSHVSMVKDSEKEIRA